MQDYISFSAASRQTSVGFMELVFGLCCCVAVQMHVIVSAACDLQRTRETYTEDIRGRNWSFELAHVRAFAFKFL